MKKLLLHTCCAPCGSYISYERLAPRFDLSWYFYNPNLVSQEEYDRRLSAVEEVCRRFNWPLIVEPYEHSAWQTMTCSRGSDPERGLRCHLCYSERLVRTARRAQADGFDIFGTTLLVSPYKDAAAILEIGQALGQGSGPDFLSEDFQADDGYRHSQEMAKQLGLYRQRFCGCEYSLSPQLAAQILKGVIKEKV